MSQQIINVGATANDGTGDTLRLSQQKANANFTELYGSKLDSVVGGTNVTIDNTDPLNPIISSSGGGGTQNLNEVLVEGNTTGGENISISSGDSIILDNGSLLRKGTIDAGYGGANGIAQICAVGYELKWEAGRLYVMGDGGTTIREVSHNFTTTPAATDDVAKGFIVGSRWLLDNGDLYICTDNTSTAAVWELQVIGTQNLQNVTDLGSTTTNALNVQLGDDYSIVNRTNVTTESDATGAYAFIENTGKLGINSGDFEGTIQANDLTANNVNLEFPQKAVGSYTIATTVDIPTKTSDLINDGDDGISHFISLNDLPSNVILYPTNVASDIGGYVKLVTSITDTDYNTTAVDISTGAITTTSQLISSLATPANIIVGNPGVFNITTIGNIRRTAGSGTASFYFQVYKRTSAGTETLITTSDNTIPVLDSGTYIEFSSTALWNDGIFLSTDRVVLKFYANRISGGSNPTYEFQFGGTTPVRSFLPIPLTVVPVLKLDDLQDVTITSVANNDIIYYDSSTSLWKNKQALTQVTPITLTTGGWSLVSGLYEYEYSNAAIFDTSIVDVIPTNASISIVKAADILPATESFFGSVKIYATNLPTASIVVTFNIFN
jgi:hypothetical protein